MKLLKNDSFKSVSAGYALEVDFSVSVAQHLNATFPFLKGRMHTNITFADIEHMSVSQYYEMKKREKILFQDCYLCGLFMAVVSTVAVKMFCVVFK